MAYNNNHHVTTDTGFAAFLATCGVKLLKLDTDTDPAEFLFEVDGQDIGTLKFQWETGTAQGNLSAFLKAYRGFTFEINKSRRR